MTVIAVTGLAREARIARRAKVVTVVGAGDGALLEKRLGWAIAKGATGIISFGIAGALAPLLKVGDTIIATHVVHGEEHYRTDTAWSEVLRAKLPEAHSVVLAGHDQIVSNVFGKRRLFALTGAHAVDMESHIAARLAWRLRIPFVAVRTISDPSIKGLPPAALEPLSETGKPRLRRILASVASDPGQIPDLMATGRESGRAFRALKRARNALGVRLGCPHTMVVGVVSDPTGTNL
jgi:hopanoid-associated phosphorylase